MGCVICDRSLRWEAQGAVFPRHQEPLAELAAAQLESANAGLPLTAAVSCIQISRLQASRAQQQRWPPPFVRSRRPGPARPSAPPPPAGLSALGRGRDANGVRPARVGRRAAPPGPFWPIGGPQHVQGTAMLQLRCSAGVGAAADGSSGGAPPAAACCIPLLPPMPVSAFSTLALPHLTPLAGTSCGVGRRWRRCGQLSRLTAPRAAWRSAACAPRP